jgi:hypothetical protein
MLCRMRGDEHPILLSATQVRNDSSASVARGEIRDFVAQSVGDLARAINLLLHHAIGSLGALRKFVRPLEV